MSVALETIIQTVTSRLDQSQYEISTNNMQALKLAIVGPVGCGKTTIANFLADATEMPFDYHPTQGVRILEFEVNGIEVNGKRITKDIELWDSSGDRKFENCWPAIKRNLQGVIFVYSTKLANPVKQIHELYDYYVLQTELAPENCVILYYSPEKTATDMSKPVSSAFVNVSHVRCNVQDGGDRLKTDFRLYLGTLMTKMQEYEAQEEKAIMNDNILFVT